MARLKFVVTLIFISIYSFSFSQKKASDCSDWVINPVVTVESDGASTVVIEVKGSEESLNYLMYEEKGNLVSQNYKSNRYTGLKPGKYGYTVIGKGGCKVSGEIDLK